MLRPNTSLKLAEINTFLRDWFQISSFYDSTFPNQSNSNEKRLHKFVHKIINLTKVVFLLKRFELSLNSN